MPISAIDASPIEVDHIAEHGWIRSGGD